MIGSFGKIVFETSDKRILTFSDFKRDTAARWSKHEVIGKQPVSEYLGPDLDTITFKIDLNGLLGVKPREEAENWLRMARSGQVETLVIGTRRLGLYKWKVTNVSQLWPTILNNGEVLRATIDVTLEEYAKG